MAARFNSIDDLRLEVARLKGLEREQAIAIRHHFSSPGAIFSTIFSLLPKFSLTGNGGEGGGGGSDILQMLSGFILPFTLNKTIFKKSNFIVKTLVRLASQRASQFISKKNLGLVWDKIKSFIPEKKTKPGLAYTSLPHIE